MIHCFALFVSSSLGFLMDFFFVEDRVGLLGRRVTAGISRVSSRFINAYTA